MKKLAFSLILLSFLVTSIGFSQDWSTFRGGTSGAVHSIAYDSVSGSVYVGGLFNKMGGVSVGNITKWDGTNWQPLGTGLDGKVTCLSIIDGKLYAGGEFTHAGGVPALSVAVWDSGKWSALGVGFTKSGQHTVATTVFNIVKYKSEIYACGLFDGADGSQADYIAAWDGKSWHDVGGGFSGANNVAALAVYHDSLFAGGDFISAGSATAYFIAKWDGHQWYAVRDNSLDNAVTCLTVFNDKLYAGGVFKTSGSTKLNYVGRMTGKGWTPLAAGFESFVTCLLPAHKENLLYAGGGYTKIEGQPALHIAGWDGAQWQALGSGLGNTVLVLGTDGQHLLAGGRFTTSGSSPALGIAEWGSMLSVESGSADQKAEKGFYPVPSGANVYFDLPETESYKSDIRVKLIDISGRVVAEKLFAVGQRIELQRNEIPTGMYFYTISASGKMLFTGKLIWN